ncbi:DUF4168 domain-containing protein [Synechocystis sp. LKSZ1]|uniref:DUF4168 domain-containing protein n=1 Tax=Synechocystis sp. LKSZ1 TaxID=3144951 RepID=UPI00336C175B
MIISSRSITDLNKVLSRFFIANSLALLGLLGGVIPDWSGRFPVPVTFSQLAYSQEFSPTQINRYAKAVLDIEAERKVAYRKIQDLIGRVPPNIVCNQKESIRQLPKEAQSIAVNFCNRSKKIAQASGLSPTEFNTITDAARKNAPLKKRIQQAIVKIRQP